MSPRALIAGSILMCGTAMGAPAYAQCTKEPGLPISRYEIQDGQVRDKETKLTWQRCLMGQKWRDGAGCTGTPQEITWAQAQKLSGPWRLPTKDELQTLMSSACLKSANSEAFPGFNLQYPEVWSSTETVPGQTWIVNLTGGAEFNALQSAKNGVLLVQGDAPPR
ncbi:MAG: DUF1566 domain-containing protein [Proteobacteria bacterium]|nr:DUF1566 domain-containing protein [Pseudomonadota bacterium]